MGRKRPQDIGSSGIISFRRVLREDGYEPDGFVRTSEKSESEKYGSDFSDYVWDCARKHWCRERWSPANEIIKKQHKLKRELEREVRKSIWYKTHLKILKEEFQKHFADYARECADKHWRKERWLPANEIIRKRYKIKRELERDVKKSKVYKTHFETLQNSEIIKDDF